MMTNSVLADTGLKLTKHAQVRCQQRGVTNETITLVVDNADMRTHTGSGCIAYQISAKKINEISKKDTKPRQLDRVKNIVLLVDKNERRIITVLRDHGKKTGKRYRKVFATHKCR